MDVLKVIGDLKDRLWKEHGDVLKRDLTQNEVHMTYYLSDLLERHGMKYQVIEGQTLYTEKAAQRAFVAGIRIGAKEADAKAESIVADRIASAHYALDNNA